MTNMAIQARPRRLYLPMIVALLLACGTSSVLATPASATPLLTCSGTVTETFEPGLTNAPQEVTVKTEGSYTSCTNVEHLFEKRTGNILPTVGGGGGYFPGASCANIAEALTGESETEIKWNNGESSDLDHIIALGAQIGPSNDVTLNDTVAIGEFAGGAAVVEDEFPSTNLNACSEPGGLKKIVGSTQLAITL